MDTKHIPNLQKDQSQDELLNKFIISDEDIYAAMKEIPGYLDITASDFKELYTYSFRHALDRLINSIRAADIMNQKPTWSGTAGSCLVVDRRVPGNCRRFLKPL